LKGSKKGEKKRSIQGRRNEKDERSISTIATQEEDRLSQGRTRGGKQYTLARETEGKNTTGEA